MNGVDPLTGLPYNVEAINPITGQVDIQGYVGGVPGSTGYEVTTTVTETVDPLTGETIVTETEETTTF